MPRYLAILYDDPAQWASVAPEEMKRVIAKYEAWSEKTARAGRLLGGQKLTDAEGRIMRRKGGTLRVTDGPYSESKEVIGGYFAVQADSYDEALKILADCPHLDYEGTIEVRRFDEPG
ncbi:MAG TPA: YciI family protein [Candidatus Polarisedimenticolia bacterium]|nr:YciI family protein [Candidatus Polarisedimenticolia bacterium]